MKIDIIAAVGSGKTTLSQKLSKSYNIPCYELDNIMWMQTINGDIKRNDNERDKIFKGIISSNSWIIEGSPRNVFREGYSKADYIILLDTPSYIRVIRIIKRWIRQRAGKEACNSRPTLQMLKMMFKWHIEYNDSRNDLIAELIQYGNKFVVLKNEKEVYKFLSESQYEL